MCTIQAIVYNEKNEFIDNLLAERSQIEGYSKAQII